ncbi:hypothetical protein EJB05_16492, partial [Eragrostis curvula]
ISKTSPPPPSAGGGAIANTTALFSVRCPSLQPAAHLDGPVQRPDDDDLQLVPADDLERHSDDGDLLPQGRDLPNNTPTRGQRSQFTSSPPPATSSGTATTVRCTRRSKQDAAPWISRCRAPGGHCPGLEKSDDEILPVKETTEQQVWQLGMQGYDGHCTSSYRTSAK